MLEGITTMEFREVGCEIENSINLMRFEVFW